MSDLTRKFFFASTVTLSILFSFVFFIVILFLLMFKRLDINLAISLTIIINFILWLISPYLTDFFNKKFYQAKFLSKEEVAQNYPDVYQVVNEVANQYQFPFPKIGIIPDKNPTAFTYGSARFNSRIILTEGIFHFLQPSEIRAVVAHELGHIVNRDFVVMIIASTLIQILYEIYFYTSRVRRRKSGNIKIIGLIAYFFYIIGIYLLLYLSRTREYLADSFASQISDPRDLSTALIKITYGIIAAQDDDTSKRLLQSTRHLGIIDVKNAKHYGIIAYITHNNPDIISEVMVFDKVNPWAKIAEFNSTHPLTGNRIDHLTDLAKVQGKPFLFDIDKAIERMGIDKSKLWQNFFFDVIVYFLPIILALFSFLFLPIYFVPAFYGLGLILQIPYRFPFISPKKTTILNEMRNPYASPFVGKPITLSGQAIGRGIPGYIFSEDIMYQDNSGIIFLDYNSAINFIGNIFFGLTKIKNLFGINSQAVGWFYRGVSSKLALRYLQTEKEVIRSHPILWQVIKSMFLISISFIWFLLIF